MTDLRDYDRWHDRYDDPHSDLSWRLSRVQQYIEQFLDQRDGQVRILSVCSGDGRDLLQVLADRPDTGRITATLLELHPTLADRARSTAAAAAPEACVNVRMVDAGNSDAYIGAVPADLVLLVGIMGNISDRDVQALIAAAAQFCTAGADVVWSRGRDTTDINDDVRGWFATAGFTEVHYAALDTGSRPALGLMRYLAGPVDLIPGQRLFTFWRQPPGRAFEAAPTARFGLSTVWMHRGATSAERGTRDVRRRTRLIGRVRAARPGPSTVMRSARKASQTFRWRNGDR